MQVKNNIDDQFHGDTSDLIDPLDPIDPTDPLDPTDPIDPTDPLDPSTISHKRAPYQLLRHKHQTSSNDRTMCLQLAITKLVPYIHYASYNTLIGLMSQNPTDTKLAWRATSTADLDCTVTASTGRNDTVIIRLVPTIQITSRTNRNTRHEIREIFFFIIFSQNYIEIESFTFTGETSCDFQIKCDHGELSAVIVLNVLILWFSTVLKIFISQLCVLYRNRSPF